jgi:glycosyltransferase involved in cell wall biosynthesis
MTMSAAQLTVVIPTYNPRMDHFDRVLASLRAQTVAPESWDLLIVDNNSAPPLAERTDVSWHPRGRIVVEATQGKMHAIRTAFATTTTELVMFLDDDTVAKPDLIEQTLQIAATHSLLGTWSPRVELEFEDPSAAPPARLRPMLSERLVDAPSWSNDLEHVTSTPWGGGLCVRRVVANAYLSQTGSNRNRLQLDPMGDQPGYGGDTDLAYTGCSIGLGMGVFPQLVITHLIPSRRSTVDYLLRNLEAHEYSHVLQNYYRSGALPQRATLRTRVGRWLKWLQGDALDRAIISAEDRSRAAALETIATGRDSRPVTHR